MSDRKFFDNFSAVLRAPEPMEAPFAFAGDGARTNAAIAVYRNNIRSSLSKALGEKFPVISQLVGDEFFKFAAREYFNHHPPRSPLIADYGDEFPAFLENFNPGQGTPYLADMARLEIAWLDAYRARDAAPIGAEEIRDAGGGNPSGVCLSLHPSLRLVRSRFPIASIWRRHQKFARDEKIDASAGGDVMVSRPFNDVVITTVSKGVLAAIGALAQGKPIGEAFTHGAEIDNGFDPQSAFQIIFSGNIVTGARAGAGSTKESAS